MAMNSICAVCRDPIVSFGPLPLCKTCEELHAREHSELCAASIDWAVKRARLLDARKKTSTQIEALEAAALVPEMAEKLQALETAQRDFEKDKVKLFESINAQAKLIEQLRGSAAAPLTIISAPLVPTSPIKKPRGGMSAPKVSITGETIMARKLGLREKITPYFYLETDDDPAPIRLDLPHWQTTSSLLNEMLEVINKNLHGGIWSGGESGRVALAMADSFLTSKYLCGDDRVEKT